MIRDDFAVIINSHGRPDCKSYHTMRDAGYTGKIIITVDTDDDCLEEYLKNEDTIVHLFEKRNDDPTFDLGDNFEKPMGVVVFARNEAWRCAEKYGLKYFFVMDDDLKDIVYAEVEGEKLKRRKIHCMDRVFELLCDYLEEHEQIPAIGFGIANCIGGAERFLQDIGEFCLIGNGYLCSTDRKFPFNGRVCEDWVTTLDQATIGKPLYRIDFIMTMYSIWRDGEDFWDGGMSETYKDTDIYSTRMYCVMRHPSCTKIKQMWRQYGVHEEGSTKKVLRHRMGYEVQGSPRYAFPKLVSSRLQK